MKNIKNKLFMVGIILGTLSIFYIGQQLAPALNDLTSKLQDKAVILYFP